MILTGSDVQHETEILLNRWQAGELRDLARLAQVFHCFDILAREVGAAPTKAEEVWRAAERGDRSPPISGTTWRKWLCTEYQLSEGKKWLALARAALLSASWGALKGEAGQVCMVFPAAPWGGATVAVTRVLLGSHVNWKPLPVPGLLRSANRLIAPREFLDVLPELPALRTGMVKIRRSEWPVCLENAKIAELLGLLC